MNTVSSVLAILEEKAPCGLKLHFDNVGHLVGHSGQPVRRILLALDIVDEVIEEAAAIGADLIVSHHPLIFGSIQSVTDESWVGRRILRLAEAGIAAICMHTNLDAAQGGVNDALIEALGARCLETLDPVSGIGRIGELPEPVSFDAFLKSTKDSLVCNGLRYHDAGREVCRVACCGGSGGGDIALAHEAGCDCYVTADVKYDQFLEAKSLGISLIDADHFSTENVVIPVLHRWLKEALPELEIHISERHAPTAQFF